MAKQRIKLRTGERLTVIRRIGKAVEYAECANGAGWWTLNPQQGWVPVASHSRGLRAALAEIT